jgi:hypothetical protein
MTTVPKVDGSGRASRALIASFGAGASELRERSAVAGARAGRGFRYQDAVGAWLSALGIAAASGWGVAPELGEDVTLFDSRGTVHLQVRSRLGQQTPLAVATIGVWLAEIWSRQADRLNDVSLRVGIVVDRSVAGLDPTGFDGTLASAPREVGEALAALPMPVGVDPGGLLARSHLIVMTDAALEGRRLIASRHGVPDAVADVVFRQLQARLGVLADQRSLGAASATLTATGANRIVDETLSVVDITALDESVLQGVCEHVDFQRSVVDVSFYLGVDTVPGHVVAGLVLDRPDDVAEVIDRLAEDRSALVTGPSGTGKTALAWLTAYATRQTIRWLRVRRDGDVAALLRYVDALQPTVDAPVGLVLDDIGRLGSSMWDELSREARHRPGVLMLGTAREEDLDLIDFAQPGTLVRPKLGEALAESMWRQLREREQTAAAGWREAYEESRELMLEFVYLLTTGGRLGATIESQVDRRRREGRDTELQVLRVAALAASHGGATDLTRLRLSLAISEGDLQRALARLLEEHLVIQLSAEAIGGLHRLRSEAITVASHRIPPPAIAATAGEVIRTVHHRDLSAAVAAFIGQGLISEDEAFAALTDRVRAESAGPVLVRCLDGLRLAGLLRRASAYAQILDEEQVPAAMRSITVSLAQTAPASLELFDPRIVAAVPRLREVDVPELRAQWLRVVPAELVAAVIDGGVATDELSILNACGGLENDAPAGLARLVRHARDVDLAQVAEHIAAAARVNLELGRRYVIAAGGEEHLLDRSREEFAWVSRAELATKDGLQQVRFSWLYIGAEGQDAHAAVVALCRTYFDLFPDAASVAGQALDPSGEPAGFGDFQVAVKEIPRGNLVHPEQVRWNREELRAFAAISAVTPQTSRLATEAELLQRTLTITSQIGAAWTRGEQPGAAQVAALTELIEASRQVARSETIPADPREIAHQPIGVGDVADICQRLCANALPRLYSDVNLGLESFFFSIRTKLQSIIGTHYWRLLSTDYESELAELAAAITNIHDVVCHRLTHPVPSGAMRRATRRSGTGALESAARVARADAERALADLRSTIRRNLQEIGLETTVHSAPAAAPTGALWPEADLLVVITAVSTLDFLRRLDQAATVVRDNVELTRVAVVAPYCHGSVLGDLAFSVREASNGALFPAFGPLGAWASVTPPIVLSSLLPHIGAITNGALVLDAMDALQAHRPLREPEQVAVDDARATSTTAAEHLAAAIQQDAAGFLVEILRPLVEFLNRPKPAKAIAALARGANTDEATGLALIRAAILEWELDPEGAAVTFVDVLSALNGTGTSAE